MTLSRLNSLVDKIYVINMDRRTDRMEQVEEELTGKGILFHRYSAVDGAQIGNGGVRASEMACSLSHLKVIADAQMNGYKSICIFEDDVVLADNFEEELEEAIASVPANWQMLYLGANNQREPRYVMGNIYRTISSLTTHAYLLKRNVFDIIMSNVSKNVQPVDVVLSRLQHSLNAYVVKPGIVYQREGYSDIRGGFRNYDSVLKK